MLEQVTQRATYVLLIYCDEWISHGEHLHHKRCDPVTEKRTISLSKYIDKTKYVLHLCRNCVNTRCWFLHCDTVDMSCLFCDNEAGSHNLRQKHRDVKSSQMSGEFFSRSLLVYFTFFNVEQGLISALQSHTIPL